MKNDVGRLGVDQQAILTFKGLAWLFSGRLRPDIMEEVTVLQQLSWPGSSYIDGIF